MKKLVFILGLGVLPFVGAQAQSYGGYSNVNSYDVNYSYYNDDFYNYATQNFPDDYFYNYPVDYYSNDYYESMYNDYRSSINTINWNALFRDYNLNRNQINLIISLNNRFSNFNAWFSYYGMNPSRWYYDRFYWLQNILGPKVFVVIQNNYYNGYNPVVYYQNYWKTYYRPRIVIMPKYKNINVRNYRVERNQFFQNTPQYASGNTNTSGFRGNYSSNHSGFSVANNQHADNSGRRIANTTSTPIRSATTLRNDTHNTTRETNTGSRNISVRDHNTRQENSRSFGTTASSSRGLNQNSATRNSNNSRFGGR